MAATKYFFMLVHLEFDISAEMSNILSILFWKVTLNNDHF